MKCPICSWSSTDPEYLLINEYVYWRVVLAPNQCLLGRCVINLKRHCGDLSELNIDELMEWKKILNDLEMALRKAFNATSFNWSCYMNLSYQQKPYNPHIHWWEVPRYNHSIEINKNNFEDPDFGKPYSHTRRLELPLADRERIVDLIRKQLLK
jgi:diadenosine tetraphosphate (Ap4A) HIT family hydrolase